MREIQSPQLKFGEVDISKVEFSIRSRDEMPQLLRGLQYIYVTPKYREPIFALLEKKIAPKVSKGNGRPGMELWKILVMGVVRLNLNWNYDRLHDEVNNHRKIREMLGHGEFEIPRREYAVQTLRDNVSLFTEELLGEINAIVVGAGHNLVKKKDSEAIKARMDSFVVESNVHYPTDINLLYDAMRKVCELSARECKAAKIKGLRQSAYHIQSIKNLMRKIQTQKHSSSKQEDVIAERKAALIESHQKYLALATKQLSQVDAVLKKHQLETDKIAYYRSCALKQINLTKRRVIHGEVIPHEEKVFSLFEPHTEWISKGKAGVPVEFGLKVCIVEDQWQFILMHQVMQKQMDCEIAVDLALKTKKHFPDLKQLSTDKGFHSKENQIKLQNIVDVVVIPSKGKLSKARAEVEFTEEFRRVRHQHSAIESAINALEVHGLDVCPDKGLDGFKRYVAMAIVSRNLQRIGTILEKKEQRAEKRQAQRNLNQTLLKAA